MRGWAVQMRAETAAQISHPRTGGASKQASWPSCSRSRSTGTGCPTLSRPMEVVLVHPEIPHNTGCAARLAAALGLRLHLVEPLGFSLEDRYLKRAGLDYWPLVDLVVHASWANACAHFERGAERPFGERVRLFTARGGRSLFATQFAADDVLVFGRESTGLPAELVAAHADRRVYVPIRREIRSLNLANVVCLS